MLHLKWNNCIEEAIGLTIAIIHFYLLFPYLAPIWGVFLIITLEGSTFVSCIGLPWDRPFAEYNFLNLLHRHIRSPHFLTVEYEII